jgi:hypothetical protein
MASGAVCQRKILPGSASKLTQLGADQQMVGESPIPTKDVEEPNASLTQYQGRSKAVAAFGRKPLNFRIPSGLAAPLEQP